MLSLPTYTAAICGTHYVKSLMPIGWESLTCTPTDAALKQLAESWGWMLREPFVPVVFSAVGDVFLEPDSGGVWWLNTGVGELTQVAESPQEFRDLLGTEFADEWFLPSLVESLHAAGKIAQAGQCYTYVTLPVFAEGKYDVANLNPVPVHCLKEKLRYTNGNRGSNSIHAHKDPDKVKAYEDAISEVLDGRPATLTSKKYGVNYTYLCRRARKIAKERRTPHPTPSPVDDATAAALEAALLPEHQPDHQGTP